MKRLGILLMILLLVACTPGSDPVDPINPTDQEIDLILNGDEEITINLGETFTDPGVFIKNLSSVTFSDITIEGTVDTTTEGTYIIRYTYVHDGTTYQGQRTVHVVDNVKSATCTLIGDESITIPLFDPGSGVHFEDPGYQCSGDTDIIDMQINNPVNDEQVGTYIIVYNYFNGTDFVEFERTVTVEEMTTSISCEIESPLHIDLTVNDSFTVPNYTCTGDPLVIDMQVDNQVNMALPGTYEVIYNYFDGSDFVDIVLTVQVSPVPIIDVCTLIGEDIELIQGNTFTDPGYNCTGENATTSITVSGYVDTSQTGTYTLTYSYYDGTDMIELTRTVTVIEDTTSAPVCTLVNPTLVINQFDTYTDPGYNCTGDTSSINMRIDGTVDTLTPGEYAVTYTYTSDGLDVILTRTITVHTDNFILLGDEDVTIMINHPWTDPGFSIDNGYTVTTTGTVDVTTTGEYEITYSYTNSSGNIISLTRTVTVIPENYYINLSIDSYNGGYPNNYIHVFFTGINISYKYETYVIEVYEDDSLFSSTVITEGENEFRFDNLSNYKTYTVYIVGTYTQGSSTIREEESITSLYMEPEYSSSNVTLDNEILSGNEYSIDFDVDNTGSFQNIRVTVYQTNGTYIEMVTTTNHLKEGTINLTLDDYKSYNISFEVYYYDGNEYVTEEILTKTVSTSTSELPVIYGVDLNMHLYGNNKLKMKMDNYYIEEVYIDGVKASSNMYDGFLEVEVDDSHVGQHNYVITKLELRMINTNTLHTLHTSIPISYEIPTSYLSPPVLADFENDTSSTSTIHNFDIHFYNPENYVIDSALINNTNYEAFDSYTSTLLEVTYSTLSQVEVKQFVYTHGGMNFLVEVEDFNYEVVDSCSSSTLVTTAQDVWDMISSNGGCYTIMNDIDLGGNSVHTWYENNVNTWAGYDNPTYSPDRPFVVYGNGHTISGFVLGNTITQSQNRAYGFFSYLTDSHIRDLNLDVIVNVGNNIVTHNPDLYIGGLAGYIENTIIENVTVSGYIGSTFLRHGSIGGIVGHAEDSFITECSNNAQLNFQAFADDDTLPINAGGIVGYAFNTDIELVQNNMVPVLPSSDFGALISYGGIAGFMMSSSINDAYMNTGQSNHVVSGHASVVGGVVGQMLSSKAQRIYNVVNINTTGFYAGGLVGYVSEAEINDSFVGNITINSNGGVSGYITAGEDTYQLYKYLIGTNLYVDYDAVTQVNGSYSLGYTMVYATYSVEEYTLYDNLFYSNLQFLDYYYDTEDYLDSIEFYPEFE